MNYALKAALLSGLVFPGLGQLFLKHYQRGIGLMLAVLASLSVIVVTIVQRALAVLEQVQTEGGAIDMEKLSAVTAQSSTPSGSLLYDTALGVVAFCWAFAIVDAYNRGKQKDAEQD